MSATVIRQELEGGRKTQQVEQTVVGIKGLSIVTYPSGNGSYVYRYASPLTGKKTSVTLGAVSEIKLVAAAVQVADIELKIAEGIDPRAATQTLGEWFDLDYLPSLRKTNRSWRDHLSRFNSHIRPALGHRPVNQISSLELRRLIDGLQPSAAGYRKLTHLSVATVNRVISLVKVIFAKLVAWGILDKNPARDLKVSREQNLRRRVLRDDEVKQFFDALLAAPVMTRLLVTLLVLTGIRLGEALKSTWADISLENRTLWLGDTKSGKPRTVPLSDEALRVMEELAQLRVSDSLFPGKSGSPMSRPGRQYRALIAAAGTPGLWMHDLRRTFSTLACRNGASVHDVSQLLGHSNIKVTERYIVAHEPRLHAAAESVGRCLSEALARPSLVTNDDS